ncbi:MAG: hypothetical protein AAFV62_04530 [Pseudomonadota bacterium]
MFFKSSRKEQPAGDGSEFRNDDRRDVTNERVPYEVLIEGVAFRVADLSDKGFSIVTDEASAPQKGMAEMSQGGHRLSAGYVMRAWGSGRRVGYRYATDLPIERVADTHDETLLRARGLRRRLTAEINQDERMRHKVEETPKTLFSGSQKSVSGIRERLGYTPSRRGPSS